MSKRGIVIVISGPSGSGKGTVVKELRGICPSMQVSVSATTRLPREGETNGVEYYFKTREEFEGLIERGEVLEYTQYNGNYYGTLKSEAERIISAGDDLILEIEVDGGVVEAAADLLSPISTDNAGLVLLVHVCLHIPFLPYAGWLSLFPGVPIGSTVYVVLLLYSAVVAFAGVRQYREAGREEA